MLAFLTLWVRESWHVEMALMDLGNYAFFFTAAGLGIVMTIYISKLLPPSAVCRWLSKNTIIIFPYHRLAFNVFTGIGVVFFGLQIDFKDTLFFSFLFTAGALLASVPVVFIIRRYMPWVAGLSSGPVQPILQLKPAALQFKEYRAGSGKKDRRLSENSALLDVAIMRPSRRADYETTQTESRSSLQGQGGDSSLARR
jgi:hypothetical protein